jgi:hypothetical protein
MLTLNHDLWALARSGQPIDATELASAVEAQAVDDSPDFRTRLLIRDTLNALSAYWGQDRLTAWLARSPVQDRLRGLWQSDLGPAGFPSLTRRIMDATQPETVLQLFRDLGSRIDRPARLDVGGSTSLILAGILSRQTDDIDVADEMPAEIRVRHDLLEQIVTRYGLALTHFQSHYLPIGWQDRVRSLDRFGKLDVFLVDVYDVLLSKLFSERHKDLDDLRAAAPRVDKETLGSRLRRSAAPLLGNPLLAEHARRNWYIVYGEPLPV